MAITAAQRQLAITVVLGTYEGLGYIVGVVPAGTSLSTLLPGINPIDILASVVAAMDDSVDDQLTTVLNNIAGPLNDQLAAISAQATILQSVVSTATVAQVATPPIDPAQPAPVETATVTPTI